MKNIKYLILITLQFIFLTVQGCAANEVNENSGVNGLNYEVSDKSKDPETEISVTETPEITYELSTPIYNNFKFGGQKRFYFVYLPVNYSSSEAFPLVIYLHSYGGAALGEMEYTKLNEVADANNFVIAFPSGKYNWNSGLGDLDEYAPPDLDDVGFIKKLIEELEDTYSIDLDRVYATGHSNGGFMSYKLACELSDQIAAIAPVGGALTVSTFENCNPQRPMPIMHIHGTGDAHIPIEGLPGMLSIDETLDYWVEYNECEGIKIDLIEDIDLKDNSTVEIHHYSGCAGDSEIEFYKVINGGHTWPGAGNIGYPAGYTNQDFDASLEIWEFFKEYKLP